MCVAHVAPRLLNMTCLQLMFVFLSPVTFPTAEHVSHCQGIHTARRNKTPGIDSTEEIYLVCLLTQSVAKQSQQRSFYYK
jgi:hypothetical protein